MRKSIGIIIFCCLVSSLNAQNDPCIELIGYDQSICLLTEYSEQKYRITNMQLGEPYLNPCIFYLENKNDTEVSVRLYVPNTIENNNGLRIFQMKKKVSLLNFLGQKNEYRILHDFGNVDFNTKIELDLKKMKKITLHFESAERSITLFLHK